MIFNSFTVAKDYTVLARNNRFYRSFQVKKTKLYLLKLPNRTSSTSSYTSGAACLISCEISLFVTAATGKAFCSQLTRVWRRSLGGGGE